MAKAKSEVGDSWLDVLKASTQEADVEVIARQSFVVFSVGKEQVALSIEEVEEITQLPHITPLPQTDSHILGVCNVRGSVYTVFDLGLKLNVSDDKSIYDYLVVLKFNGSKIAIPSMQAPGTQEIEQSEIDKARNAHAKDDLLHGILKSKSGLVLWPNLLKVLSKRQGTE